MIGIAYSEKLLAGHEAVMVLIVRLKDPLGSVREELGGLGDNVGLGLLDGVGLGGHVHVRINFRLSTRHVSRRRSSGANKSNQGAKCKK